MYFYTFSGYWKF